MAALSFPLPEQDVPGEALNGVLRITNRMSVGFLSPVHTADLEGAYAAGQVWGIGADAVAV